MDIVPKEIHISRTEARELIEYFLHVYKFTKADLSYLIGISRVTIDEILQEKRMFVREDVQQKLLRAYENINPKLYRKIQKEKGYNKFFKVLNEQVQIKKEQDALKLIMLEHRTEWKEKRFYIEDILDREHSDAGGIKFYPEFENLIKSGKYIYINIDLKYINKQQQNRNQNTHLFKVLLSYFLVKTEGKKDKFIWFHVCNGPTITTKSFIVNY